MMQWFQLNGENKNFILSVICYNIIDVKISVYLPDSLKSRLDSYVKNKGLTSNAAIRKAVELLLSQEKQSKWGGWVNQIEPDIEFPSVDDLRKDLIPPKEIID